MKTWEEIRDEVAGMLADGQPLEDIISKLEQRKNEMAKAELVEVFDELKKPKPLTNEEYMQTCSSDELANTIFRLIVHGTVIRPDREYIKKWLKEKHDD